MIPADVHLDVVANLLFGIPVILVPLVMLWDAPGENRTRLDKAAELTLFYLPYTACSQIGYELMFLIGHPLDCGRRRRIPGWKWLWWQYGLADTRYTSGNHWTFGLEIVGVTTGSSSSCVDPADQAGPADRVAYPLPLGGIRRVRDSDE